MEDGEYNLSLCFFEGLNAVLHKYIIGEILLQNEEIDSMDAVKRFDFDYFLEDVLLFF